MSSQKEVLYFAHAVNCYDTPYEEAALSLIRHAFSDATIVNPNSPVHQRNYIAWRAASKDRDDHKGMNYFYDFVLKFCTGSVAMPFLDERFGLGVAGELKNILEADKPIWGMFLSRPPTKEHLEAWVKNPTNGFFVIRKFNKSQLDEIRATNKESDGLVVGHQETRLRTWTVYNVTKRPYEEAHLVQMPIPEGFYPDEKK